MKEIPLTQGKVALVDEEIPETISGRVWYYNAGNGYAFSITSGKTTYLHRLIMGAGIGQQVDHINGDKLDNRRANLRLCTHAENQHNRKKNSGTSSRFKGVYWHNVTQKWQAYIRIDGDLRYLGLFEQEEAAAKEYDRAAKLCFGEFARFNFPAESGSSEDRQSA